MARHCRQDRRVRVVEPDGDWTHYRSLPGLEEIDFHLAGTHEQENPYDVRMAEVHDIALSALRAAQTKGIPYILFTHGRSTSGRGKTTARSVVRGLMRSPEATPYIIRGKCEQSESVYLAVIRPIPRADQKLN